MIPHRIAGSEISGSGLRNRVTACRKRLRESRVMLKPQAAGDVEELFPESSRSNLSARSAHPIGSRLAPEEQIEEQEVGIT
jgi:hypothetical protein